MTPTSSISSKVLSVGQTLDGGKVLPGFKMPMASLFADLGQKPQRPKS